MTGQGLIWSQIRQISKKSGKLCSPELICQKFSQRSYGSGSTSTVIWLNVSIKLMILADGLTSMSSCIFIYYSSDGHHYLVPLSINVGSMRRARLYYGTASKVQTIKGPPPGGA